MYLELYSEEALQKQLVGRVVTYSDNRGIFCILIKHISKDDSSYVLRGKILHKLGKHIEFSNDKTLVIHNTDNLNLAFNPTVELFNIVDEVINKLGDKLYD